MNQNAWQGLGMILRNGSVLFVIAGAVVAGLIISLPNMTRDSASVEEYRSTASKSFNLLPEPDRRDLIERLHAAAAAGDLGAMQRVLARGAPADSRPQGWWTPLMQAVGKGREDAAKLLIERGADVNARIEAGGTTVLMVAVMNRQPRMVKLLLESGADPNAKAGTWTALYWARIRGSKEMIRMLERAGARSD